MMVYRQNCLWASRMALLFLCMVAFSTALWAEEAPEFTRMETVYKLPDVSVVRQDGKKLPFLAEVDDGRPVMLNFIFASCTAICPMLSHMFAKVQDELGKGQEKIHLVSVSIDPESDTPTVLAAYAKKLKAGVNWDHYTGNRQDIVAIQNAFNAYRGDKMKHAPLTFMRPAPGKPWLRLEGFLSPSLLLKEYHAMLSDKKS